MRHFTLTGVLSLLIHRLRKTALYSLQAIDALKSFAKITLWKSLRKSMVLQLRNSHHCKMVTVKGNFPSVTYDAAKGGKKNNKENK